MTLSNIGESQGIPRDTLFLKKSQSNRPQMYYSRIPPVPFEDIQQRLFQKERYEKGRSAESFKQYVEAVLNNLFKTDKTKYLKRILKLLDNQWQNIHPNLTIRINNLYFKKQYLVHLSYSQLQKYLIEEWKHNLLFYDIKMLFYHTLSVYPFYKQKQQLQVFFKSMRNVVIYLTNNFFSQVIKQKSNRELCLCRTALSILTRSAEWSVAYKLHLKPLIATNKPMFIEENYPFEKIIINKNILDVESGQMQFPRTKQALVLFIHQTRIKTKLRLLAQYRIQLMSEIQQKLVQNNLNIETCADQTIACLQYIIANYKLKGIGDALAYIKFVLGEKNDQILQEEQIQKQITDLKAIYDFFALYQVPQNPKNQLSSKKALSLHRRPQSRLQQFFLKEKANKYPNNSSIISNLSFELQKDFQPKSSIQFGREYQENIKNDKNENNFQHFTPQKTKQNNGQQETQTTIKAFIKSEICVSLNNEFNNTDDYQRGQLELNNQQIQCLLKTQCK